MTEGVESRIPSPRPGESGFIRKRESAFSAAFRAIARMQAPQ